ncbi:MAG TPA: hypothetical protein VEI82_09005, partial [Myxococcota bacterium]|nr:hypothetical protein [Myxococcota bacterium]
MSRWGGRSPHRTARRAVVGGALWLALAAAASVAQAGSDPGLSCRMRQLAAASRLYRATHACWAKAYQRLGDPSSCLVKAEDQFRRAYASAAATAQKSGAHCGLRLDVDSLLSIAASDVDPSVGALTSDVNVASATDLRFRARLISAAGDLAERAFSAEIVFAKRGDDALRQQQLADAATKFHKTFTSGQSSALAHGILYDGPPADTVSGAVEGWAALWERITRANLGAFSLSGTIFAAESTFVDSDVNDTNVPPIDNGTLIEDAQPLPVPSTVGGYVNLPGVGPTGNSFDFGDKLDRYHAALKAGQVVLLSIGDPVGTLPLQADLDLCLWGPMPTSGSPPTPICSVGYGAYEIAVAPADGEYFIEVYPKKTCACSSTYTLSVGQTVPAAAMKIERTDVEFEPGELIVKLGQP